MNIVTGYRGEPHITSAQDRDANQGSYGTGSYILNVGSKMAASIVSANEVRIADGALSHQGCVGTIDNGLYESCAIANGSQGMKRRDLIVCRYEKDANTNIESLSLVVIQGTPAASNPSDPSYNTGNIQEGDSPVDMPLYRVNINGVAISSVTQLPNRLRTQQEMDALLGGTNISGILPGTVTGIINQLNNKIGSTALPTTAQTLTGAIAEHETDINSIKSDILVGTSAVDVTVGAGSVETRTYTFARTLSAAPKVFITLVGGGSVSAIGNVSVTVMSVTTTSFKLYIYNDSETPVTFGIMYLAVV